jgi:uncharacterized protein (DUF2062 family)/2-polyprenyl-3-methyl-5-hydroxy-6-metoxy-1,4-benzoquinol methylase
VIQRTKGFLRKFATALLTEGLAPGPAATAVFWGVFIGVVPIYGLQTLAALGLAFLFRLNKPLILAATFINNPFFLPFLIGGSLEMGSFLRTGKWQAWQLSAFSAAQLKSEALSWVLGSLVVGVLVGGVCAAMTASVVSWSAPSQRGLRARIRFVNRTYRGCASFDRGFVRWKMRLDRIFSILACEDLGTGTVVDLGCGYGMALCFTAFHQPERRLVGCDLNAHRINVARQALSAMNAQPGGGDVRQYELPPAGLILILDVLQYLSAEEQLALLKRCCASLQPGGRLIFRVHDRERGLRSFFVLGFDWLLFSAEHVGRRPLMLSAEQYHDALVEAGMRVEMRRFRNLLPFAHILFLARRAAESES